MGLYYRYRSGSELSIKELIYDELYFASRAECNDPYEGKVFAKLEKDEELWDNLIRIALKFYASNTVEYLIKRVIDFYVSKAPLYLDELLKIQDAEFIQLGNDEMEKMVLRNMHISLKEYISLYLPVEQYFACFSKNYDNYLMWSHYANNHSGFCLVFRTIDGKIKQSPDWKRKIIPFEIDNESQPFFSLAIPDDFTIKDVEYIDKPNYLDGFMCFPGPVVHDKYTPEQIEQFQLEYSNTYMQKHTVWAYEDEARAILSNCYPWITGKGSSITPHQRLFHYDSTQLIGIVLGIKMPESQKRRIKEIISDKVDRWYTNMTEEKIISKFVLFEEKLSETNREVIIEPIEIYGSGKPIDKSHKDFSRFYEEWKEGHALHFKGKGCSRIQIKD